MARPGAVQLIIMYNNNNNGGPVEGVVHGALGGPHGLVLEGRRRRALRALRLVRGRRFWCIQGPVTGTRVLELNIFEPDEDFRPYHPPFRVTVDIPERLSALWTMPCYTRPRRRACRFFGSGSFSAFLPAWGTACFNSDVGRLVGGAADVLYNTRFSSRSHAISLSLTPTDIAIILHHHCCHFYSLSCSRSRPHLSCSYSQPHLPRLSPSPSPSELTTTSPEGHRI